MSPKDAVFVREQYGRYMDIVAAFVEAGAVGEVNLGSACRSAALALVAPAAFRAASALERVEVFDRAVEEVEAVVKSNLFADMLMYCQQEGGGGEVPPL
jgi:hypothetical protein